MYYEIANGACEHALASASDFPEPVSSVFAGAAAACLAAFHGRADLWPTAYARLDAVSGAVEQLECSVRDLHRMLLDIVTAHRQDPGAVFGRQRPATGTASSSCPVILAVVPHHGPASGQQVRLVGQNLGPVVTVYLSGENVWTVIDDVSTVDGREATVLLKLPEPGSGASTRVQIKVSSWPFEPVAEYTFDEETPDRASSPHPTG
ncbi:IPT/TIG domain-containing protein [Saccharothrix carnea]|uniref:IPT/TIG domain-containing protein n=1 Tax=Saccharothrix carnea TaxID=1280637 RepID=UPI0011B24406|nr:IPT/TIG domain-containing protein [Saccharothrix carnea]